MFKIALTVWILINAFGVLWEARRDDNSTYFFALLISFLWAFFAIGVVLDWCG